MSFEVYVQFFEVGGPACVPRTSIRSLFPVDEARSEPDSWAVVYDSANSCRIGIFPSESDSNDMEGFCVSRPCGDLRLWVALLDVLRLGPGVLYFPGCDAPLVASPAAGEQLPADLVEALGPFRVVSSAEEILHIIEDA